jgi:hypothetical protein
MGERNEIHFFLEGSPAGMLSVFAGIILFPRNNFLSLVSLSVSSGSEGAAIDDGRHVLALKVLMYIAGPSDGTKEGAGGGKRADVMKELSKVV